MKKLMKALIVLCFVPSGCVAQMANIPNRELIRTHKIDNSLKAILDEHKNELFEAFETCQPGVCIKKERAYEFTWLPGYVVKTDISRIPGLERVKWYPIVGQNLIRIKQNLEPTSC